MQRRTFLAASGAGLAASALPADALAAARARRGEPFQLKYGPHFGMFGNHAKSDEDQLKFAFDEGFRAW
jgi:hydroxypyruvate isomerase